MRILLTSVGRRGYLVKFFKEALGSDGEVWGGDNSAHAPAFHYCDNSTILPKVTEPDYIERLIYLCKDNNIDIIVPLIDPELEVLAQQRDLFYNSNIMVVVSPPETIQIAFDKYLTYKFAKNNSIAVPETVITIDEAKKLLANGKFKWPLVVKPRNGSASADITYCDNEKQLKAAFELCPSPMIQEFVKGKEYGYDIFSDKQYQPIGVFCKLKLAMRAGETDQAVSVNDKTLIDFGTKLASSIKLFGPLDVDVVVDSNGPKLLEMNPRFGGGYPCAHLCGADFPKKLISLCHGHNLKPDTNSYPAGIYMLKQDEIISPDIKKIEQSTQQE